MLPRGRSIQAGLANVQERLRREEVSLRIGAGPGNGTEAVITVPKKLGMG